MPQQVVRLTGGQADELVPFLDRAFAFENGKSFKTYLEALYDPRDLLGQYSLALRQDGRLVAAVGVFPLELRLGGATLRIAGIGHVSCDPTCRGQGHMSTLLGAALKEVRAGGYDLSWLSGQRQRYGHFGWEQAGCQPRFDITQDNLRHHFAAAPQPTLQIVPLGDDPALEQAVRVLHDSQFSRCQRPGAAFGQILRHWRHQPVVALDAAGRVAAYAVLADEGARIVELVGRDTAAAVELIRAHLAAPRSEVRVGVSPWDTALLRALSALAGGMGVCCGANWQVFNWARTLDALLKAKLALGPLPNGALTLAIRGSVHAVRLSVKGGLAAAEECPGPAEVTLDPALATRVLLGPLPPWQVVALPAPAALLNAWCPLPLYLPEQDSV